MSVEPNHPEATAPPPTYAEAEAGRNHDDQPPSYDDLYGHVKDMQQQSSGPPDFLKKFILFFLRTLCCSICIGFISGIPIAMIVIGAVYKDDCPAERYIPIYLIVGGSFALVKNVLNLWYRHRRRQREQEERGAAGDDMEVVKQRPHDGLLSLFLCAWFIAGCVWVYGLSPNTDTPDHPDYCHPVVYYFTYWLLASVFIMCALSCCCSCCVAFLGYKIIGVMSKSSTDQTTSTQ